MAHPKIKICGVTALADAQLALALGADYLGLNFYRPSPRYLAPDDAALMASALGETATLVGVFVDASAREILEVARTARLTYAQLHGQETSATCAAVQDGGVRVIKAFRVRRREDVAAAVAFPADAILLDAFHEGLYGGTGRVFDWSWLKEAGHERIFLAGGINADNVAAAAGAGVYALDVCSGIESAPGVKDHLKMRRLFAALEPA